MNIFTRNGIIDSFTSFFTNNGDTTRLMSALFNHRRFYWCILTLLACCLVFGSTALRAEDLQVSVDRNRLAFGESFTLTVDTAMKLTGEVDFSPLEQDFEILSTSKGSRINYINGQVEASTTWTLELSPKKEGQLTIPPLQINGSQSKAISITVDKNVPGSAELYSDIFIEMDCEPRTPYIGQQVLCRLRLFYGPNLKEGSLNDPETRDAVVRKLGKDQTYQENRNGKEYSVSERRFALFFQTSGQEEIGAPVFTGKVVDARFRRHDAMGSFFEPFMGVSPTKLVRVVGKPVKITVQPRPAEFNDLQWLPATDLTLGDHWSSDATALKKGDLISRTVTIEAKGLTGAQLPDPAPSDVPGFKVYADKADESTVDDYSGVNGKRTQEIAFIADKAGTFSLPAITMQWWDTVHGVMREASLPARTIVVSEKEKAAEPMVGKTTESPLPPPDDKNQTIITGTPSVAPSADPRELFYWKLAAFGFGGLWLGTFTLWLIGGRRLKKQTAGEEEKEKAIDHRARAKQARALFLRACSENNKALARKWLLDWATNHYPGERFKGLGDLARKIEDHETRLELETLDAHLYRHTKQEQWSGKKLGSLLADFPKNQTTTAKNKGTLPPLYQSGKL